MDIPWKKAIARLFCGTTAPNRFTTVDCPEAMPVRRGLQRLGERLRVGDLVVVPDALSLAHQSVL